jgi:birA, biotin-[acetyl-CoA-carboxylase] ligase region
MTSLTAPAETSAPLQHEGWTLHFAHEIGSTNSAAAKLPAWHAVHARVQTDGRGRTGRRWVSDEGGLWLSAVVPCPGQRSRWSILPLAAGWAIIDALRDLGATDLRLRWPNDIMHGRRKLAGLLVERYTAHTAVIGIGLNVFNHPAATEPALEGVTTRLADLVPGAYTLDDLARTILRSIRRTHTAIRDEGFRLIADQLNLHWSEPRLASITLTGRANTFTGLFHGIDSTGRIRLTTERYGRCTYDASQVSLFRELE